jgi:hypothetical protein
MAKKSKVKVYKFRDEWHVERPDGRAMPLRVKKRKVIIFPKFKRKLYVKDLEKLEKLDPVKRKPVEYIPYKLDYKTERAIQRRLCRDRRAKQRREYFGYKSTGRRKKSNVKKRFNGC